MFMEYLLLVTTNWTSPTPSAQGLLFLKKHVNGELYIASFSLDAKHTGVSVIQDSKGSPMFQVLQLLWWTKSNFNPPFVIADENCDQKSLQCALERGEVKYEKFLETGDPGFPWKPPQDEWKSIALG
ncbi:hypothetical protein POM88_001460 [Heracleum sosnowskyi]|uniref:Uncharacterized protein n=1 Tax=Heracleum sosnowskyi TaxID=360622 RepID=A0AAD8JC66_9APIA|nr:hypothetical protein POM88_001460 [Heracleum sosnowskyi]